MKFFKKNPNSEILKRGLTYKKSNNSELRKLLVKEQFNFCAYTEKYITLTDSVEIEHFNPSIKDNDNYYNYYAVIRWANLYKKDEKYKNAAFFSSLFFQHEFERRIRYVPDDFVYEEIDPTDHEARSFIDFIGLRHPDVAEERKKHMERLESRFDSKSHMLSHFTKCRDDLSYITAIEAHFGIDLSNFYLNPKDE